MACEAGWAPGRHVALWVSGSDHIIRVTVVSVHALPQERAISVVLQAFRWSHDALCRAIERHGRDVGGTRVFDVTVRLGKSTAAADPVYDQVSRTEIFAGIGHGSTADSVINILYGNHPLGTSDEPYLRSLPPPSTEAQSFLVSGRSLTLTPDQKDAVRLGTGKLPIVSLQAAFGTGKTLVDSLIAAISSTNPGPTVIVTTSTNAAVAQFTETLLSLGDFPQLTVVRHIADTAAADNRCPTPVDLSTILKTLGDSYADQLDADDLEVCHNFRQYRQLLEDYLEHPDLVPEMSDEDKEEYEIAEQYISRTLKRMVRIMFKVRRPSVICMTTASLLNSTAPRTGIFTPHISSFHTVIGDEASQIPEPALLAIASRLPRARHVYIGDVHQLAPHSKCPAGSNPVLHGARSVMSLLTNAPAVPVAPLITTFRSHPALVALPNCLAYQGALVSGTPAQARQMLFQVMAFPAPQIPFAFINVYAESVRAASRSHYNEKEAEVSTGFIRQLIARGIRPADICVITFYREQYRQIRDRLAAMDVELTTVDSVQGREKEVVILLTTKTDFAPESAEFLDDYRRLNVAISRCRQGQFIFGHTRSLLSIPSWGRVLQWVHSIGAVIQYTDIDRYLRPL